MIREKRQAKVPEPYSIPKICYPRIRRKKPKKKVYQQCNYQTIPHPLKYIYNSSIYPLFEDIILKEQEGKIVTDVSLLGKYIWCKEIQVREEQGHKILGLAFEKRSNYPAPTWQLMAEKLKSSENPTYVHWGKIIERYSLRHEEMLRNYSNGELRNEQMAKMIEEENSKTIQMFRDYPCIIFRARLKNNFNHLKEIVMNDKYVRELGYSLETLPGIILQEGLPQLLPVDNMHLMEMLLENYYNFGQNHCQTPECVSELILKHGYTKKVKFQTHYLLTYENGFLGLDCVTIILDKEPLIYVESPIGSQCQMNEQFLKEMALKERETRKFLQRYYDTSINQGYADFNKICKLKDLHEAGNEKST